VIEMASDDPFESASRSADGSVAADAAHAAARALSSGPMGAYLIAGIAVALLFIGWLAFYFLLFMPRGAIG
jgi:hypothetical protein